MSVCKRCGAEFSCAMVDGNDGTPCWCTAVPPAVPVPAPETDLSCWCPACLKQHIDSTPAAHRAEKARRAD